jgi:ribonuclease G
MTLPNVNSLNKFTKDVIAGRHNSGRLDNFKLEPEIDKHDKIDKVLGKNSPILVQVVKEPISTKGPAYLAIFLSLVAIQFWYRFRMV